MLLLINMWTLCNYCAVFGCDRINKVGGGGVNGLSFADDGEYEPAVFAPI